MAGALHQFARVDFSRFKAFRAFSLHLRHFNILVGPNNSGKSTILTAFRILAAGLRKANTRKAETVRGPRGRTLGYTLDLRPISVAEENIFYNYDDSEVATIRFILSNKNELLLYFPEHSTCYLIPDAQGKSISTPTGFKSQFNCSIGFVPILGPVEHNERLFDKEAARLALFNYTASRNFRNIWYHYPEKFEEFRSILTGTWPDMDIERPRLDRIDDKTLLHMFCPEKRIPREIFWSHSTEIISEAEADDIVLINKDRASARRIREPSELRQVFTALGSNINPILTQLAKTRRALFVEGYDFQILSRFAQKLELTSVASRSQFSWIRTIDVMQSVKQLSHSVVNFVRMPLFSDAKK